ncbi:MAG: ribose-5-phosphate isomerase RpiA [Planctomycetaceae bacterium]|nr:ribose-5-phosphate isomerase RpiA [Planctomycetaceae bacterium]
MNAKRVAAEAALQYVENGMRVGLGTGSTALEMLELLAERIRNGLTIEGIPTSEGTAARARELNIPLATDYPQRLANQVTLDGADRVDPEGNLIKGGGGALLREKLVARAADKVVIMVDPSKHLPVLGPGFALPVEIVPFGQVETLAALERCGCQPSLRMQGDQPFHTDGGHLIADCAFGPIHDPRALELRLSALVGVVETGLFVGLTDVVVTDPDGARLIVFRQRKGQGLDAGTAWPGLLDVQQVRAADFNKDGRAEIVVLSGKEKTLGLTQLSEGRLAFPVSLPTTGEPQAVELVDLDADGQSEVLYVSRQRDGGSSKYELRVLQIQPPAADVEPGTLPTLVPGKLGGEEKVELDLRGAPRQLLLTDADADGRPELLIYPGLDRPPHHYRITAEGKVKEIPSDDGIGIRDVQPGELFIGTLNGSPVTLAAHKKFVRNLRLEQDRWVVTEQYNATESEARVAGTAALDLDGQPGDEIVLIDSGIRRLRVLRKKDEVYRPWKEVELGRFPYLSSKVADLDGDGRQDLLLFGRGKFAVLYAGRVDPQLSEIATFESKLKDTWFADVVAGDLNSDGRPDVVLVDTQSHFMELLHFGSRPPMEAGQSGTPELRHALHFPVYEEKSFQRSEGGGSEPRETLIQDVTGDGRPDLILLIHDRLLVYPQDSGEPEEKTAGEDAAGEKTAKP